MPRKWNKIPTHNFCRFKKKNLTCIQPKNSEFFLQIWELPVDASLQSPSSPHCKLQESFPFLLSDHINFRLACRKIFFLCPHFLIPHFPISLPSTRNIQCWQSSDELHPTFSLSCPFFPCPPPREEAKTPNLCDQVQCSCPLFSCYFLPQTTDFLRFSYSPE